MTEPASRRGERIAARTLLRNFFLGFVKIHILHHAGEAAVYGRALIAELRRHGYELSPGTLYPVLHHLEETGYLSRVNRVVNGKVRKYYVLTRRGGEALAKARDKISELVSEVLEAGGTTKRTKGGDSPSKLAHRRDLTRGDGSMHQPRRRRDEQRPEPERDRGPR